MRNTDATVEQCRRVVESNLEEVGRMSTIVEDLLTLSRTGEWGDQMVAVDLSQLAVRIGEKMKSIARSKHITLSVVKNSTAIIRGNPTQLERMLYNLVHNAITYTPEGGDIEVRVQAVSDSVRLTVKDTGVGIDAKDLPHVFERFYRSGRSETYPWSGAGLGLSIVKGIVLEYQGNIDIESTVGKGTKVSVTFPAIT